MAGDDEAISVSAFLEAALYAPRTGFYEAGGRAGRRGDFLTSPEVGPLFGVLVGRALDRWWDGLGRPDPFLVDEHGAGPGTLARGVLQGGPRCATALRWTLVERSAAQRDLHPAHLPHLGDLSGAEATSRWASAGGGAVVASAAERPSHRPHVVVANELLDNLAFDLAEHTLDGWQEVRLVPATTEAAWREVLVPLDPERTELVRASAPDAPVAARVPIQDAAAAWVADSVAQVRSGGRVLVLDYGSTTGEMAARPWRSWLRTHRAQQPGGHPFAEPGTRDVTVEVALDQLVGAVGAPHRDRSQAEALTAWGIDDLVEEARRSPAALAGPDALAALRLRSRIREAEALLDPDGLGAFRVWEWLGTI